MLVLNLGPEFQEALSLKSKIILNRNIKEDPLSLKGGSLGPWVGRKTVLFSSAAVQPKIAAEEN